MVSSYTLLKEKNINNTLSFSNKYRHDFEYNNLLEVSKDKVSKYNSNDTVIEYRETNYTYDNLGNIISINKKYGENAQSISINRTNVYTYNNGLLERITSFDSSYRTRTYDYYGNTTNIKYYNSSNLLTKEEEFTYSFNKLIRYKVYNSNRVITIDYSYIYDHNNIRIKKINNLNNDVNDYIVYDNNVLYSDGLLFIYNGNELIGFNYNDKTYSYEKDITGNIIAIIRDGIEIVRYIYDAFGNMEVYGYDNNGDLVLNNNDSFIGNINPFRYKSYYYDKESGLYYLNSRYYNSEIGRFISPDDISYLDSDIINGLNLYCYCNNNPVMYSDPDGYFWDTVFDIFFIGWDIYNLCTNEGYKDWKNWVALGLDVIFAVAPFISDGGQIVKIADVSDSISDFSKVTVIGETTSRVQTVAQFVNATDNLYDGFKAYDRLSDMGKGGKVLAEFGGKTSNVVWLYGKLRSGYKVVDIGIDIGRVSNKTGKIVRSSSYIVERIFLGIWESRNFWKWFYHLGF